MLKGMLPSQLDRRQVNGVTMVILFVPHSFNDIFSKEMNPIREMKGKNSWQAGGEYL
jgi:hypothetical protein